MIFFDDHTSRQQEPTRDIHRSIEITTRITTQINHQFIRATIHELD